MPHLATEIAAGQLSHLKLVSPSEQTSADVAAGIVAAMYGQRTFMVSSVQINAIFDNFKVRQQFHFAARAQSLRLQPLGVSMCLG